MNRVTTILAYIFRLAEKDVHIEGKHFKYFVMQSTGGGNFPAQHAHAETALNVLEANIVPILGLKKEGIEYDVLQVRSCARGKDNKLKSQKLLIAQTFFIVAGVTAQNVFRMSAPASNMVMIYGLGGLGMTTMGSNALLLKALMDLRQKVSTGAISNQEYKAALQTSSFGTIRHWSKPNPFSQNIAQFVDHTKDTKIIFNKLMPQRRSVSPLPFQKTANFLLSLAKPILKARL